MENFDASKIMELVGQQKLVEKVVEHLAPVPNPKKPEGNSSHRSKSHKTYNIPVGTPAYTPTPISVLKKSQTLPSKVENYEPSKPSSTGRVATYKPSSKVSSKILEESYTPSTLESTQSRVVDNYVPSNSSNNSTATYKPSKVVVKSEEGYTPSTLENTPDVNYTPSSRDSDNVISDRYTPPSSLNCDVDYQPTTRELSSVEPSYSPSCSKFESGSVDYSPSSISTLTTEPSYSPAPASNTPVEVDYTPSSKTLTPEKYLELFEIGDAEEAATKKKHAKDEERRRREKEKEREREKEKRRRKEKEKEKKSSSSKSSDQDSKSKRSSNKHSSSSGSSSKKSKSSESKSHESSKSSKNEAEMESDSDVDDECYRIFKVKF